MLFFSFIICAQWNSPERVSDYFMVVLSGLVAHILELTVPCCGDRPVHCRIRQHPWPLATSCQRHPPLQLWQPQRSPDIPKCSKGSQLGMTTMESGSPTLKWALNTAYNSTTTPHSPKASCNPVTTSPNLPSSLGDLVQRMGVMWRNCHKV